MATSSGGTTYTKSAMVTSPGGTTYTKSTMATSPGDSDPNIKKTSHQSRTFS
ncbi:hypothetical protein [Lactobacillus equicursoris]|uniref:hypothetical protein n=1 Tax=Lactobacillus equicursoris TaxID=420645 RepID=UPI0012B40E15|nr:hypothetical protein [Lactobacillus equicursoris]